MSQISRCYFMGLLLCLISVQVGWSAEPAVETETSPKPGLQWHENYAVAMRAAIRSSKMMLVYIRDTEKNELCERFESRTLSDPAVVELLLNAVVVRLPLDATILVNGEKLTLLEDAAFDGLQGRPGLAVIDFVNKETKRYGAVVNTLPLIEDDSLTVRQIAGILDPSIDGPAQPEDTVAEDPLEKSEEPESGLCRQLQWHDDYMQAVRIARREGKMLFICFEDPNSEELCREFAAEALSHPEVLRKLKRVVPLKLTTDVKIRAKGKRSPLLEHASFAEMLGQPGVAMIDYVNRDTEHYGRVVSTFPFLEGRPYTPEQLQVILDLPPGSLTQRTLIYAVRTHPERPASSNGTRDLNLVNEATKHSLHQAKIRLQGHHNWDTRFRQINTMLPQGLRACEVCAESWPGENLVEAAIECVRCWRYSSGHWSAVRAYHDVYGYDMKRGSNGVWYATGIFGR